MLRSETAANPARMQRALAGLRKYQEAMRPPAPEPMPALARTEGAALRDYGGEGLPVLFVPSLINPPTVLDLGGRSLLRWLAGQGRRVLLLDWGWPGEARRPLSVAGHVERILLPLMRGFGEPVDLVGYCLGGTMATAAAQLGGARSLALIAAPWRFAGFPPASRDALVQLWTQAQPAARAFGLLPMEVLQQAFWSLDPARTVAKFEAFAETSGAEADAFVALEDWANDGPPIPVAAARELMEDFFGADLPGTRRWQVGGEVIDPDRLDLPVMNIVSIADRIVPSASAMSAGRRFDLDAGHVGMVIGSRRHELLWRPLAAWLAATRNR